MTVFTSNSVSGGGLSCASSFAGMRIGDRDRKEMPCGLSASAGTRKGTTSLRDGEVSLSTVGEDEEIPAWDEEHSLSTAGDRKGTSPWDGGETQ